MEDLLISIIRGEFKYSTETLLILYILGMLTKRHVPWWIYEDALKKLKEKEDKERDLIDRVNELFGEVLDAREPEVGGYGTHSQYRRRGKGRSRGVFND